MWQDWAISEQRVNLCFACILGTGRERKAWGFSNLIFHAVTKPGWDTFQKDAGSFIVCRCVQLLKNNRGPEREGRWLLSCFLPGIISAVWVYWRGKVWPEQLHGFWLCQWVLKHMSPSHSCLQRLMSPALMSPAFRFEKPLSLWGELGYQSWASYAFSIYLFVLIWAKMLQLVWKSERKVKYSIML